MDFEKNQFVYPVAVEDIHHHERNHEHNAVNGTYLILSHVTKQDLTFCKVDTPFAQDPLHITIPTNHRYHDILSTENGRVSLKTEGKTKCKVEIKQSYLPK